MKHKLDNKRARAVIQILQDLKSDFILQQLDCRVTPIRKPTDKTIEEILDFFDNANGFKMFDAVLRQGIYWQKPDFYEICLSAYHDGVEYFIFADIGIKDYQKYIQEKA